MSLYQTNTLVRDKIPELLQSQGKTAEIVSLSEADYIQQLNAKLQNGVDDFFINGTVEALADIGEVMHAVLALKNISVEEFQQVRLKRLEDYGSYEKRYFLNSVSD